MKKTATACLLVIIASVGFAQIGQAECQNSIYDIQTDIANHPNDTLQPTCGIITALRYNGFYLQEHADPGINPNGEYSGIWVYVGPDPVTEYGVAVGDYVGVCGLRKEYFDLTELDIPAALIYGYVLPNPDVGGPPPPLPPIYVTAAQVVADGEVWESVRITIVDGMQVPFGFDMGNGNWAVDALDGTALIFDDYWYDFASVMEGQCYNNATGIYYFGYGAFKLEPFVDGIPIVDCAVGTEAMSLGTIKAMFR